MHVYSYVAFSNLDTHTHKLTYRDMEFQGRQYKLMQTQMVPRKTKTTLSLTLIIN